jgi:hypothetical protein
MDRTITCSVVVLLLSCPRIASAQESISLEQLRFAVDTTREVHRLVSLLDGSVTITIKDCKDGRLQDVMWKRYDAKRSVVAKLHAKEVELRVSITMNKLLVRMTEVDFAIGETTGWLAERTIEIPLVPRE